MRRTMSNTDHHDRRKVRRHRRLAAFGLVAMVALVGTACGDDSVDTATDGISGDAEEITGDVEEAAASVDTAATDLADTLRENGLESVASAVESLDVTELIDDEEFTFFAPSDEAFLSTSGGDIAEMVADPTMLTDVLRNHVIDERLLSADLADGETIQTEAGGTLTISVDGAAVMVDDATVETADIDAGGGVIHVVDQILLP
jgi:uncharacterized surface protein with fasciclin (FAS1) repeats